MRVVQQRVFFRQLHGKKLGGSLNASQRVFYLVCQTCGQGPQDRQAVSPPESPFQLLDAGQITDDHNRPVLIASIGIDRSCIGIDRQWGCVGPVQVETFVVGDGATFVEGHLDQV